MKLFYLRGVLIAQKQVILLTYFRYWDLKDYTKYDRKLFKIKQINYITILVSCGGSSFNSFALS